MWIPVVEWDFLSSILVEGEVFDLLPCGSIESFQWIGFIKVIVVKTECIDTVATHIDFICKQIGAVASVVQGWYSQAANSLVHRTGTCRS